MAEEAGEIPQHLKESVKSADAYEQQARRDYQVAMKAWLLRIPNELMATSEGVRRYAGILHDLEVVGEWRAIRGYPEGTTRDDHDEQVASLHGACNLILQDGFPGRHRYALSTHLQTPLEAVARRYGLRVEEDEEGDVPDFIPVSGLWTTRHSQPPPLIPWPDRQWRSEGASKWWALTDLPGERHDPEHLAALAQEGQRQGLQPHVADTDPAAHVLLARMVHVRQVLTEISTVATLPLPAGLTPTAAERLVRIKPLAQLALDVVQEEFQPGHLSPGRVTDALGQVGRAYGLMVTDHTGRPIV